jgi:hypothetical protein
MDQTVGIYDNKSDFKVFFECFEICALLGNVECMVDGVDGLRRYNTVSFRVLFGGTLRKHRNSLPRQ